MQAAQNQKLTNAGVSAKLLKLKIGAKVMLAVNVSIQDCLTNGQLLGIIRHIGFAQGSARKVFIKFSDEQLAQKQ